jgi:Spy/CpxP family protein refolding chaperone
MHPGFIGFWRHGHGHEGRGGHCGVDAEVSCGPGGGRGWGRHGGGGGFAGAPDDGDFGGFGVRRPLRFLAFKLELEEEQVEKLATILDDLKTERAQASVDHRRSTSGIAEAIAGETLDTAKLADATAERVKSAERLRDAVVKAIGRIHAMLTAEQRTRFAYLIRTGVLSI